MSITAQDVLSNAPLGEVTATDEALQAIVDLGFAGDQIDHAVGHRQQRHRHLGWHSRVCQHPRPRLCRTG